MEIRRAFVLASYALVLTGVLSLALAEGSPLTVSVAAILCLIAYWQAEVRGRQVGRLATNLLVFASLCAIPLDYLTFTGDALLTLSHFLLAVQIVKLFGPKAPRDYVQVYLISLMHLGVAAILTIDLVFSVAFLVYMIVATWTLILFTLVRELDERGPPPGEPVDVPVRLGRRLVLGVATVSGGTLLLSALLFVVFPRFSAILFQIHKKSLAPRVSGFSDEIGLTDLSAIKENQDDVMRVVLDRPGDRFPDPPKWRGLAFDRYENGRWRRSWQEGRGRGRPSTALGHTSVRSWSMRDPPVVGRLEWHFIRDDEPAFGAADLATYTVLLSPTGTNALFGVPMVRSVKFLSSAEPQNVVVDAAGSLIADGLPPTEVQYRIESLPMPRWLAREASVDENGVIDGIDYLAPPEGPDRGRIAALARQVIAASSARTPYERAIALEDHLRTRYRYTLDLAPAPEGVDPIDDFLFVKKEGHCELFATAYVLMARAVGLPARLVNGFQSGEWNDFGSFYQVRQSDAHAWAEVHFEGPGWVELDPTPPGENTRPAGLFASWRRFQDYLKMRWLSYVISYNLSDQLSLADRIRRRLDGLKDEASRLMAAAKRLLPKPSARSIAAYYGALSAATALAIAAAVLLQRRLGRRRRASGRGRAAPPVPFYDALVRALARRGWRRAPTETPREFAARVGREGGPALVQAAAVVEAFYEVRFGARRLEPARAAEIERALAALEAAQPV